MNASEDLLFGHTITLYMFPDWELVCTVYLEPVLPAELCEQFSAAPPIFVALISHQGRELFGNLLD